ncbi:MAG: Ig-like domain-containing protein, partial [Ruminococcus sp.]|nr:Ig-like domain-containing protein [Ruminococcus sp.]
MNYKALVLCACALCTAASCITYKQSPDSLTFTANAADSSSDISFTAIGQYTQVTISNTTETPVWYSDNSNVATVDSSGTITAVGEGSCTIYAVFSSQMLSFSVTVTLPEEETDFVVGSVELSNDLPVVQLSLGSLDLTNAVWSSSDESVAVVDQEGTVTAVGSGSCIVTASVDGKNYIVNITSTYEQQSATDPVTEVELGSVELSNGSSSVAITLSGIPDGTTVQWSSTDESVAVVDQEGVVTAVGSGSCQIIALIDEVKYITYITSTYDPSLVQTDTVVLGEITLTNENYSSVITLSGVPDGTTVQWSSSDESVAVVDQEGVVTAVGS